MTQISIRNIPFLVLPLILLFQGCMPDCIEKGPPVNIYNATIEESKQNGVFKYQTYPDRERIKLDTNLYFKIDTAWVENAWGYECINNKKTKITYDWQYMSVKSSFIGINNTPFNYFLGRHIIGKFKHYYLHDTSLLKFYVYQDTTNVSPELKYKGPSDSILKFNPSLLDSTMKQRRLRIIDSVIFSKKNSR